MAHVGQAYPPAGHPEHLLLHCSKAGQQLHLLEGLWLGQVTPSLGRMEERSSTCSQTSIPSIQVRLVSSPRKVKQPSSWAFTHPGGQAGSLVAVRAMVVVRLSVVRLTVAPPVARK